MDQRRRLLFIGRWCPFHEGHKYIIDSALNAGNWVAIAVRESDDEIPARVRQAAIEAVYDGDERVIVFKIPDIHTVAVGRGVGYALMEAPQEIKEISGTEIRAGRQAKTVPEAAKVIEAWKARGDLR